MNGCVYESMKCNDSLIGYAHSLEVLECMDIICILVNCLRV